jgi:16S rRNA (uracil1498-N3)-methyltransferase
VFHHRDTQALTDIQPIPKQVDLLIGPEGGLSENEIKTALGKGFKACTLGGRVFRTETAPVAALGVLQWLWGDFNAQGNEP